MKYAELLPFLGIPKKSAKIRQVLLIDSKDVKKILALNVLEKHQYINQNTDFSKQILSILDRFF